MIVTTTRHGRTRRDTRYLLAHLSRQTDQRARVVSIAAPVATASEALCYMEAMRDGSRATVAYHHVSLSPSVPLTDEQRDEAVARVLAALGAEEHAYALWEHSGKGRRGADVDTHYHIVLSHVGPDGRALDDSRSYVRLEAVARSLEHDFGHDLTRSRRATAVAAELERTDRPDVAARVRGEAPPDLPMAAMSSRQRARSERHGISLPDVRVAIRTAWEQSDSPAALRAALAERRLGLTAGDKAGVWLVVMEDGTTLGALDRLAGERRRAVASRMEETPTDDPAADPARDARPAGDIRRSPREPRSRRVPEPAADAARPASSRGRQSAGRGDGPSARSPRRPAKDAGGDRGAGRADRRAETATGFPSLIPRRCSGGPGEPLVSP